MSEMLGTEAPRMIDRNLDHEAKLQREAEARARILVKLNPLGEIFGTMDDLRMQLKLGDMSKGLFKGGCWYLASRGCDGERRPLVIFKAVSERDNDPRPYHLKFIKQ